MQPTYMHIKTKDAGLLKEKRNDNIVAMYSHDIKGVIFFFPNSPNDFVLPDPIKFYECDTCEFSVEEIFAGRVSAIDMLVPIAVDLLNGEL
jgi:hypothetical protein